MANRSDVKELQETAHVNECFVCKKKCFTTCSRCGEFYCSKHCQNVDWREHKYYCFEMPELTVQSSACSDYRFNSGPKFQSDNRRVVQNLRNGVNHSEEMASFEDADYCPNSVKSVWAPQPAAFNFGHYPKNNDDVIITHVRHANSFYIRTCASENDYKKNAKDFDDYGRDGMQLRSLPRKNDIVLVRHSEKYHRAIVLNDDVGKDGEIEVALIDIGRKIATFFRKMRELSDELRNRRRYNFVVTLGQIPFGVMPFEFKKLRELVNNRTVFKIQFDGYDWKYAEEIKLLEKESGLPIERFILRNGSIQYGYSKLVDVHSRLRLEESIRDKPINHTAGRDTVLTTRNIEKPIKKPITFVDLATEILPDVAELVVLDNSTIASGFVCAVAMNNVAKLEELHHKINEYGNRVHEVHTPRQHELCLVKFEGEWNRAVYADSKFLFIDWGNTEDIDKCDVRRFPKELKDPCYTFACNIQGADCQLADDPAKIQRLKELLEIQSDHPDCRCLKVGLMEYDVIFPKLFHFFD